MSAAHFQQTESQTQKDLNEAPTRAPQHSVSSRKRKRVRRCLIQGGASKNGVSQQAGHQSGVGGCGGTPHMKRLREKPETGVPRQNSELMKTCKLIKCHKCRVIVVRIYSCNAHQGSGSGNKDQALPLAGRSHLEQLIPHG